MAFNVVWELDESEGLNADSLLGRIELSDGIHSMVEESVYLDSWLVALLGAARTAAQGGTGFQTDIIEESPPLRIHQDQGGALHVAFGGKEVIADSAIEFTNAIGAAARDFMKRAASVQNSERNATLDQIRRLVAPSGAPQ